jgi:lipopolysaccharide heptosyltransferase II
VMALHVAGRIVTLPLLVWPPGLWPRRRPRPLGAGSRILLMRVDGIGDFIMTTALFPALRRAYPDAQIDLVCSTLAKPLAELYVRSGDINTLYPLPLGGRTAGQLWRLVRQLRENRYDAAVDLRGDFRNVLLAWLGGASRRFGLYYSGLDYLLTDVLAPEQGTQRRHQAEEVAAVAAMLGMPEFAPAPRLLLGEEHRAFAERWLIENGVAENGDGRGRVVVAFHLTAGMPARLWPLDRFIEVARRLVAEHDVRVMVVGSPDDRAAAEAFSAALEEPALIAAGATSLAQSAALMERSALFIGTDSGPAHVASSVGCPLVVLFGPGNEQVMRPYAQAVRIVRSPVACDRHCHNKACAVPERHCLKAISVDAVCAAARELLRAGSPAQCPSGDAAGTQRAGLPELLLLARG